jgi:hypothetical protein
MGMMGDMVSFGGGTTQGLSISVKVLMEFRNEKSISSRSSVSPVLKLQSSPPNGSRLNELHRGWMPAIVDSLVVEFCCPPGDEEGALLLSPEGPCSTKGSGTAAGSQGRFLFWHRWHGFWSVHFSLDEAQRLHA